MAEMSAGIMQEQLQSIDELLARHEIKKAEVLIAKCLRSDPPPDERAQTLVRRARARLFSGRPEDALDDLLAARSLLPSEFASADLLELVGDCFFARFELASMGFADKNDARQALGYYKQILEQFPQYENFGWVEYQMGRVLLADSRAEEALGCFQRALFSASHVTALTAYCFERMAFVAFYEHRDYWQALVFVDKAIHSYPASEDPNWLVQVHTLRSRILRDMQRHEEALKAAETALSVASDAVTENKQGLAEALLAVAELLITFEGREREVIAHLQQFLQISKKPLGVDVTWSRVHEMLGDAYFKTGQYSAAVTAYESVLQFNPYHPWELSLYYRIARSWYQQGEYDKTVRAIQRMLEAAESDGQTVSDYRVYDVLGNAQFALKRYDQAVESYRMALQVAPPNADNLDKIRTYHDYALELSRSA